MEAIRDIIELKTSRLAYELPKNFPKGKVEIIIIPISSSAKRTLKNKHKSVKGILREYANPSLRKFEKDAWAKSVSKG